MLQGSIVALITPFKKDGNIDYLALSRLIDFHIQSRTNAILFNGTTGESPTISLEEFETVGRYITEKINGRIPVIAGIGGNNTSKVIRKARMAEKLGVDYLLAVSPAYNKPTRMGLLDYYGQISDASGIPIILYNVPGRTGSNIPVETIIEIGSKFENIIGVKEASGDMDRYLQLISNAPYGFSVYAGDDSLAVPVVLMGGMGCISVVANLIPNEFANLMELALNNKVKAARQIHFKYLSLMHANFIETNPIPVKTALAEMGYCEEVFRSPLSKMEIQNQEKLLQLLAFYNLTESKMLAIA